MQLATSWFTRPGLHSPGVAAAHTTRWGSQSATAKARPDWPARRHQGEFAAVPYFRSAKRPASRPLGTDRNPLDPLFPRW